MASRIGITGQLARELLKKFPDTPLRTLARILYRDNPLDYNSYEHARSTLRLYAGKQGKDARKRIKSNEYYRPMKYKLPESQKEDYTPYDLPVLANRVLILSDTHIPYHDNDAITAALDYGKERKMNTILLNGDTIDCYSLSRFVKNPKMRHFDQELKDVEQFLDVLKTFNVKIYFKKGNHEERLETYLKIHAPELFGMKEFQLENLLHFGARGIECISDQRIVMIGKLPVLHGHEFQNKSQGVVNPARTLFTKGMKSAVVGHSHRTSIHTDSNLMSKIITCWSSGCLCGLHPEYARINKWNHGAVFVERARDGAFKVDNFRINEGKLL